MVQAVESELKQEGLRCYRVGGSPESEWMVMDYLDAVVHVFSPRAREYYAIEQLWSDAPRLEVSG
jgi:ribosome-associated protein